MPKRYLSEALQTFPDIAHHTAPLTGVGETIYNRLWRSIISGRLKSGTKLSEDVICNIFSVSRTILRKVLVIMEQEGIVELPPNYGAYVATPTPEDAHDVVEAAKLINVYTVTQLSAPDNKIDPDHLTRIRQHIALQEAAEASGDFAPIRIISGEFHVLLVHIHGNRILAAQYENLITRLTLVAALYQRGERKLRAGAAFQRELIDRILAHDQKAAIKLVTDFYEGVESSFVLELSDETDIQTILTEGAPPFSIRKSKTNKGRKRRYTSTS